MRIHNIALALLTCQTVEFIRGLSTSASSRQRHVLGNTLLTVPEELPSKRSNKLRRDNDRINQRFKKSFKSKIGSRKRYSNDKSKYSASTIQSMELVEHIKELSKKRAYREIHEIANNSKLNHNVYTFTAIITSFALSAFDNRSRTVMKYCNRMVEYGIKPNSYTITAILMTIDGGKEAIGFINYIENQFLIKPDILIYNAAIKCCSRQYNGESSNFTTDDNQRHKKNFEYALILYAQLLDDSFEPDMNTYGNLLYVLVAAKETDLALDVWAEMESKLLLISVVLLFVIIILRF